MASNAAHFQAVPMGSSVRPVTGRSGCFRKVYVQSGHMPASAALLLTSFKSCITRIVCPIDRPSSPRKPKVTQSNELRAHAVRGAPQEPFEGGGFPRPPLAGQALRLPLGSCEGREG